MTDDKIVEIRFPKPITERQTKSLIFMAGVYRGMGILRKGGKTVGIRGSKWAMEALIRRRESL